MSTVNFSPTSDAATTSAAGHAVDPASDVKAMRIFRDDDTVRVTIEPWDDRCRRLVVEKKRPEVYVHSASCVTGYPNDLIELILSVKGPAFLCDEIRRDEDPEYIAKSLRIFMSSYFDPASLAGKRILDFGCGSGASLGVLARNYPDATFVGIELSGELLRIARRRVLFHALANVNLHTSPAPNQLPADLGTFDVVLLNAVVEHLLPQERHELLPAIWHLVRPGGALLVRETPHRYFPIEVHTTSLPFLNYLPDGMAMAMAKRFSRRIDPASTWTGLLRRGIRGATVREIRRHLAAGGDGRPIPTAPRFGDAKDMIELWYRGEASISRGKRFAYKGARLLKAATGLELPPWISLAFVKPEV